MTASLGVPLSSSKLGGFFPYIRYVCASSGELPAWVFSKDDLCGVILRPQGREWQPSLQYFKPYHSTPKINMLQHLCQSIGKKEIRMLGILQIINVSSVWTHKVTSVVFIYPDPLEFLTLSPHSCLPWRSLMDFWGAHQAISRREIWFFLIPRYGLVSIRVCREVKKFVFWQPRKNTSVVLTELEAPGWLEDIPNQTSPVLLVPAWTIVH